MSASEIAGTAIAVPILLLCLWFMVAWTWSLCAVLWHVIKVPRSKWTAEDDRWCDRNTI
jgi:hypothetical protein